MPGCQPYDPDEDTTTEEEEEAQPTESSYGPIRSRADAIAAGRRHARERGDRLTPVQAVRLAALIRPHLDRATPAPTRTAS